MNVELEGVLDWIGLDWTEKGLSNGGGTLVVYHSKGTGRAIIVWHVTLFVLRPIDLIVSSDDSGHYGLNVRPFYTSGTCATRHVPSRRRSRNVALRQHQPHLFVPTLPWTTIISSPRPQILAFH